MIRTILPHHDDCHEPECGRDPRRIDRAEVFTVRGVEYLVVLPICRWPTSTPIKDCLWRLRRVTGYRFVYEDRACNLLEKWARPGSPPSKLAITEVLTPVKVSRSRSNNRIYLRRDVLALAAATWRDGRGRPLQDRGVRCHVCGGRVVRKHRKGKRRTDFRFDRDGARVGITGSNEVFVCSVRCGERLWEQASALRDRLFEEVETYRCERREMERLRRIQSRLRTALRHRDLPALESLLAELRPQETSPT